MNTRFIVVILLFVSVLALSAVACNTPIQISFGESEPAASQWNEDPDWNDPQGEEPHFEEPFGEEPHGEPQFEEPHGEEPFHEEPHGEEPHHEEPHFEEPHHEPEPHPQEPPPQPQQPQQPQGQPSGNNTGSNNGQGANWTTDVAVTDIYPGNQPYGQIHARITNHGPGTLNNVKVEVLCGYDSTHKSNGLLAKSEQVSKTVKLSLNPGETYSFPTGLKIDTNTFDYGVSCQAFPGFNDPNPGNDSHWEMVQ
jgi:hypothetical protein